jgi:hypothetical protein
MKFRKTPEEKEAIRQAREERLRQQQERLRQQEEKRRQAAFEAQQAEAAREAARRQALYRQWTADIRRYKHLGMDILAPILDKTFDYYYPPPPGYQNNFEAVTWRKAPEDSPWQETGGLEFEIRGHHYVLTPQEAARRQAAWEEQQFADWSVNRAIEMQWQADWTGRAVARHMRGY